MKYSDDERFDIVDKHDMDIGDWHLSFTDTKEGKTVLELKASTECFKTGDADRVFSILTDIFGIHSKDTNLKSCPNCGIPPRIDSVGSTGLYMLYHLCPADHSEYYGYNDTKEAVGKEWNELVNEKIKGG